MIEPPKAKRAKKEEATEPETLFDQHLSFFDQHYFHAKCGSGSCNAQTSGSGSNHANVGGENITHEVSPVGSLLTYLTVVFFGRSFLIITGAKDTAPNAAIANSNSPVTRAERSILHDPSVAQPGFACC